jgi:hypothetical protein
MKRKLRSGEQLRGWLKDDNPQGDFSKSPRCGAKTRRGTPCQCPAMANGRCRLHGGLSTGPKTAEGIARIQRAVTKHGRFTKVAKTEQKQVRDLLLEARALLNQIRGVQGQERD